MSIKWCAASALVFLTSASTFAQEPIEPEELRVETEITPGENLFVVSPSWGGASGVMILSAEDLSYKGIIATGMTPQFAIGSESTTGYVASAFAERITYGPVSAFFQKVDMKTLAFEQETELLPSMAQTMAQAPALAVSADEKWAYIQNATPATSVSVVDLTSGQVVSEIPSPGCWGIYLSPTSTKYSTLCGDGTMVTVVHDNNGQQVSQKTSEIIFDVEKKPLFVHAERAGSKLLFVTYDGTLMTLTDVASAVTVRGEWKFTDGIEGDWAPGGYEVIAYNEPNGVLFVLMHSGAKDGSHKDGSEEIWALDVQRKKVLYRSTAEHMSHITVNQDKEMPLIFGSNSHEGGVYRYEVDPEAKFAAKLTDKIDVSDVGYLIAEK